MLYIIPKYQDSIHYSFHEQYIHNVGPDIFMRKVKLSYDLKLS